MGMCMLVFVLLHITLSVNADDTSNQDILKRYLTSRSIGTSNAYDQEPSLQDLDIGVGIGVKDNGMMDDIYYPYNAVNNQASLPKENVYPNPPYVFRKVINIGKDGGFYETPTTASQNRRPFTPSAWTQTPSQFIVSEEDPSLFPAYFPKTWNFPAPANSELSSLYTSRQTPESEVGYFKLRNDHGYRISMGVPPIPPQNHEGNGILVLEMKATIYRPVQ